MSLAQIQPFSKLRNIHMQFAIPALVFPRFLSNLQSNMANDWWTSPNTFRVWFSLCLSGSDISILNHPKGHLQNFWWFAGEIDLMFNSLLPLWFYGLVLVLSEEWFVRQHWIIKWKQSCRKLGVFRYRNHCHVPGALLYFYFISLYEDFFFGITVRIILDKTGTVMSDHPVCSFGHTMNDI